jgi:ankyrin repeat protein
MKSRFYVVLGVLLLMFAAPIARAQLNLNPFAEYYNNIPGMHVAATNGNLQIAAILIKAGADINLRDKIGSTPLDDAAEHGRLEMLKLLLDVGAIVDAENKNGMTPLMFAAKSGDVEAVRALLAHGANPNKSDYTGRDAASWALDSHRQAVIVVLKDAAAHKH